MAAQVTPEELGNAVFQRAYDMIGDGIDDAGCDWLTDKEGCTYIAYAGGPVRISRNDEAATLIIASYILKGYDIEEFQISAEEAAAIKNIWD